MLMPARGYWNKWKNSLTTKRLSRPQALKLCTNYSTRLCLRKLEYRLRDSKLTYAVEIDNSKFQQRFQARSDRRAPCLWSLLVVEIILLQASCLRYLEH